MELTSRIVDQARPAHGRLLSGGIATPGVIDPSTGRVISLAYNVSPDGGLDPLSAIRSRFDVPALIENDVNVAAFAESWRGLARGVSTFAFVWVGTGVGVGLIMDGRLVRGAPGAAGQQAYLPTK